MKTESSFQIQYCKKCLLPNSRPGIIIDENGISNVWKDSNKKIINFKEKKLQFKELVKYAKSNSKGYDCIVPVSGGKDSTWQVIKCLENGLNVLAVTWKTPARTKIGQINLDNLVSLGVDHIDYQINPKVEKKFIYKSFKKFGTTALPMHMALFNIPLTIAVRFKIPLVVWGENSAVEYGSGNDLHKGFRMNSAWLKKYGVMHGTSAEDWVSEDLSRKELTPYFGPNDAEIDKAGERAVFLGQYFKWDPEETQKIASLNGFKARESGPKTGYYNYADIDDDFISIHHFMKWYKFGFTRLFDNLALEIKNGRLTKEMALEIIKKHGIQEPKDDIKKFCKFLNITENHFYEIAETFRNKDIWSLEKGKWKIKNFPIADWCW